MRPETESGRGVSKRSPEDRWHRALGGGEYKRANLFKVFVLYVCTYGLDPGLVGWRPFALVTPPPVHLGASLFCYGSQFLGNTRLADARLAYEHDQAAFA